MRSLIAFCRTLPGATEDVKWGADVVFSAAKKMFCIFSIEGGRLVRLSFKVDDHRFLEHTDRPQFIPAPYLARAHWVSVVDRKGLGMAELKAMIARSHALVLAKLPKAARAALAAPAAKHAWGRTPVEATVDGHTWRTSVWRGKDGRTLLAVPARVRGAKGHGDTVSVTIRYRD